MDNLQVAEEVVQQDAAFRLYARNAVHPVTERSISWDMLRKARVGDQWRVDGGGHLFDDMQAARIVYKDEATVVLLFERHYADDQKTEKESELKAFRF